MGVLGDDDIEKLNESFKKRKIGKIFYNPSQAKDLFTYTAVIAVALFYATILLTALYYSNSQEIQSLDDLNTSYMQTERYYSGFITDNSDCQTLFQMYHNIDKDYPVLKSKIKNEIAFRCK